MAETADHAALHKQYATEIDLYEREAEKWATRSKKIVRLYKDEDNNKGQKKRFNVLWSNVQTLKPALYARDPKPECERRHKDADPVGRAASEVLERCVSYTIACHGFSDVMRQCVDDRLLPGRGVAWVRYCPTYEPMDDDGEGKTQVTDDAEKSEKVSYEQAIPDYVYWEDFGHNVARTWDEVTVVWRRVFMTRAKLVKRFGEEKGNQIPLDYAPKGLKDETKTEQAKKACIYEGWDKEAGAVFFLSKAHPTLIEYKADPLKLTGVFPCPKPLFATVTTDSLIPTPDYALYQTQAQELEELTARIDSLQKALRVVGVYDTSAPALANLLSGSDNKMIGVDKWAAFAEKGGLKGAVDFLPVKDVADVLIGLYESREKAKQDLYEITGIADIIRGNSEPNETATAQQIKGRFAVLRISDAQTDVQRFARDIIRLLAEIIADFDIETIKSISGYRLLSEQEKAQLQANPQALQSDPKLGELMSQPSWEQVDQLLKNDVLREFRVDVETDSTIRTDEDADRQSRTEFMTAASSFLQQAVAAGEQAPALAPFLGELLMFGIRSFKTGRTMEPAFEEALRQLQKQSKEPRPNPEMQKVQAQMQLEQQKAQTTAQLEREKMNIAAQQEQMVQQAQAQQELQRQQIEDQRAERDAERQANLERYKAELQVQADLQKAQAERETAVIIENIKAASAERIEQIKAQAKIAGDAMKADAQAQAAEAQGERDSEQADKDRASAEKIASSKQKAKTDA